MGLCTSRSSVSLAPRAHDLGQTEEQVSETGTPTWGERLSVVQSTKTTKATEVIGVRSSGGGSGGGGPNPLSKGYLELASKGEAEPQTSREAEEEEEDTDGDGDVEELLNLSDSEGSLRSEFLE